MFAYVSIVKGLGTGEKKILSTTSILNFKKETYHPKVKYFLKKSESNSSDVACVITLLAGNFRLINK